MGTIFDILYDPQQLVEANADVLEPDDNSRQRERLRRGMLYAMEHLLTPRQQQVVRLYYGEQMPLAEIAKQLGCKPAAVSRCRKRAAKQMALVAGLCYEMGR